MFARRYRFQAEVVVRVNIDVAANDDDEAAQRLKDGAWHGVSDANWDKAQLKSSSVPVDITAGEKR